VNGRHTRLNSSLRMPTPNDMAEASPAWATSSPPSPSVGTLATVREPFDGSLLCRDIDAQFRADPSLRSVVIRRTSDGSCSLINRTAFYQQMAGPRGFGWALHHARRVEGLAIDSTPEISPGTPAVEAGLTLLAESPLCAAGDDILVSWPDGRTGTLAVSRLLAELSLFHSSQAEQVRLQERRFRSLVQNSSDVVVVMDRGGRTVYISPAAQRVTGIDPDETTGPSLLERVHPEDADSLGQILHSSLATPGREFTGEFRMQIGDGSWRLFEWNGRNLLDDDAVRGVVVNFRDVTERRVLEDELRHQAFHDALTGVGNRALFADRVGHALTRLERGYGMVALLFCDLDGFKVVNDTLGHSNGDHVLVVVADRLGACLRPADTLARLGGDEFAVLVEGIAHPDEAVELAQRLIHAIELPIELTSGTTRTTATIGIAVTDASALGPDELIRRADAAMYLAKSRGRNRCETWIPGMGDSVMARHRLVGELRRGLDRREFRLVYQPIVDMGSGAIIGVEALLRWQHPDRGLISPDEFIPVAEESGLIVPIGRWTLREACAQTVAWQSATPRRPLAVSVNLSPVQLAHPRLAAEVAEVLAATGLSPPDLELEITETALVGDVMLAQTTLHRLRDLGVRIAIDDFGTGYSSLGYLREFPVDNVKIDRSFVDRILRCEEDRLIVSGVITLAHSLALKVTAEGVEAAEQLDDLASMNCDQAQGFFLARPMGPDAITALLRDSTAAIR